MKEICPKCVHHRTCRTPCYPVQRYLAKDKTVYEKTYTNEDGKTVTILFAKSREIPESSLVQRQDPDFEPEEVQQAFSTNNESPFAGFKPKLKQTGIFIDRFFHNWSYRDLAVKYEISEHSAIKIYYAAVKRLRAVLEEMDKGRRREQATKKIAERSGTLPKGQKWFLLNKLFDLMPSEIAKMEGIKGSSSVRQLIIRVSDQLRAGEIRLIDCTPEEATEAKERLEAYRAKRRDHHNRNKDQINAKRRKQHAKRKP